MEQIESSPRIERMDSLIRVLATVLFVIISEIIKWVLWVVVLVELCLALITQRAPNLRLRRFANQALSYQYRILRYVTYNEADQPFPFADFPNEIEPIRD